MTRQQFNVLGFESYRSKIAKPMNQVHVCLLTPALGGWFLFCCGNNSNQIKTKKTVHAIFVWHDSNLS